jgi:hypothetical protein
MKYIIQIILVSISFFAASRAKKQFERAIETKYYNLGIFKIIGSLTGNKAIQLAKLGMVITKYGPWFVILLFLMCDLLDWTR